MFSNFLNRIKSMKANSVDDADTVSFHAFDSIQEVAEHMVNYAKLMHPSSRIVSKARVINMLESSLGSGNSVFGIVVFTSEVPGVDVDENSNTIRDMTDHERMTLCGCKGSCRLNLHGTDIFNSSEWNEVLEIFNIVPHISPAHEH